MSDRDRNKVSSSEQEKRSKERRSRGGRRRGQSQRNGQSQRSGSSEQNAQGQSEGQPQRASQASQGQRNGQAQRNGQSQRAAQPQRNGQSQRNGQGQRTSQRTGQKPGQRQSRWATAAYKRRVDERLFGKKGDAARVRMHDRLRAAHGSPTFLRTYREYVRDYGMPEDLHTLMMLLELDDERESLKVMEALEATVASVTPEEKNLLRGRLRNLEMSTSSDALADAAVDLLGRL